MTSLKEINNFLKNERGAITLDWLVLAFGTVAICYGATTLVFQGQTSVADQIVARVELLGAE